MTAEVRQAADALNSPPGLARPDTECRWCPVRARCQEGWGFYERLNAQSFGVDGQIDAELVVASPQGPTGFLARRGNDKEVAVVYEASVGASLSRVAAGDRVRLIDAVVRTRGQEIEIRPWTEMYRLPTI